MANVCVSLDAHEAIFQDLFWHVAGPARVAPADDSVVGLKVLCAGGMEREPGLLAHPVEMAEEVDVAGGSVLDPLKSSGIIHEIA